MVTAADVIGPQTAFAKDSYCRTRAYSDWLAHVERDPATAKPWPEFRDAHPSNAQAARRSIVPTGGHAVQSLGQLSNRTHRNPKHNREVS